MFKKFISVICVITMLFSQVAFAEEVQSTNDTVESPSTWAAWDIEMSYTYGLGVDETYAKYQDGVAGNQFMAIVNSFNERFGINYESELKPEAVLTRGDVIDGLYNIITLALKSDKNSKAIDYFTDNALIYGRSAGNYGLNEVCTNEEMLTFAKRTYDFIVYTLGEDAKGCFWKVSDNDNTVYLLGSIHASDGSLFPLSKDILSSFANSQALVVEANILSQKEEEIIYAQQLMMYQDDDTIDKHISKETYDLYAAFMESIGVPKETYDKIKPWAAMLTIQNLQLSTENISGTMGIDMYFLALATGRMPIIEIEGSKYQYDMFDSFSQELQEAQLYGVLTAEPADEEAANQSVEMIKVMLNYWKNGETDQLEKLLFQEEGASDIEKEYNKKLWDDRNDNMALFVQKALEEDSENDYFLIVGAGHMLNHNGIVELLRAAGYTVEQVK